MKRFIFAHFIALFAFSPQHMSALTSFGWGSINVRYSRSEVPTTTKKCPLLRKANDLLWNLSN